MTRSLALPTVVALLALLAGCTASPGTGSPANASTTTSTDSPVSTTTTIEQRATGTYGCPYYVTVEPATDRQVEQVETIIAYSNLSAERRSEFDRARTSEGGTITMATLPEVWSRPRVVEYDGDLYATVAATC